MELSEVCKEIDRLINWAIITHPREGKIRRSQRTRDKIRQLVDYWTFELDRFL